MRTNPRINQLHIQAQPIACTLHTTFNDIVDPKFTADLLYVNRPALKCKAVFLAMTKLSGIRDKSVVKLSVTPSTKYSCSWLPPILMNGSTTIERGGTATVELRAKL